MTTSRSALLHTLFALVAVAGCRGDRGARPGDDLVGGPTQAETKLKGNLWYRLALNPDSLDVALRLFAPPPSTRFFLPGDWAGRGDFSDVIGITGASTPVGPTDVAINRDAGELEVATPDAAWVQLQYRVELSQRSDFHPQIDGGVFVAFGPTFLVTPAQQILERTTEIPIELNLPANYHVMSTWPDHGVVTSREDPSRTIHQFVAADVSELRDAYVIAGPTLRTVRDGEKDSLVEVAFAPAFEADTARFAALVTSITNGFRERFGNAGPVHVYVRTRTSEPGEFGGVGRRGGFILDVPPDTAVSPATRLLVAHEALHVWNGHLLVPAPAVESATRWFKEGVTHYLALKSLRGVGEPFILRELTQVAANYARNPLAHGQTGQALDEARLPYDFGVLVALAVDAALVRGSGGKTDVTCWLSTLLERNSHEYDEQVLFAALQECAGPRAGRAVAQIWRRWVRVGDPIDLTHLFADVGLHWLPESEHRSARLVPLDETRPIYRTLFALETP